MNQTPLIPGYLKDYLARYYNNLSGSYIRNGSNITKNSYYFTVQLTPEQTLSLQSSFKNKVPVPRENFIGNFLNVNENIQDGEVTKNYFVVQLVYGVVLPEDQYYTPNMINYSYITGTYYVLNNFDIDPKDYTQNPRPIVLPSDAIIDTNPDNVAGCESNQNFANSLDFGKIRSGYINFEDSYPVNKNQPISTVFYRNRETDLTTRSAITLYNVYVYPIVFNSVGISQSVEKFIEYLN